MASSQALALLRRRDVAIPVAVAVLLFSPRLVLLAAIACVAFVSGLLVGGGISLDEDKDSSVRADIDQIDARIAKVILADSVDMDDGTRGPEGKTANGLASFPQVDVPVQPPPVVDAALGRLVANIVKEFVTSWWAPLNVSKSGDFEHHVDAALRFALVSLGAAGARAKIVNVVSPITQTLVRHIAEYRMFEASSLPLEVYLVRHPDSVFHKYADSKELNKFLRRISAHIVASVIPRSDRESPVVFSLLREILATAVLGGVVESYSDPDVINKSLITYINNLQISAMEQRTADTSVMQRTESPDVKYPKSAVKKPDGDQLFVKVVEARQLPISQGSLFFRISYGNSELRSEVVGSETQPVWMEDFAFDWEPSRIGINQGIYVEIYVMHELVGVAFVPLSSLQANKYMKDWFPIDTSESRFASATVMAQIFIETMIVSVSQSDDNDSKIAPSEGLNTSKIFEPTDAPDRAKTERNVSENVGKDAPIDSNAAAISVDTLLAGEGVVAVDAAALTVTDALKQPEILEDFQIYLESVGAVEYLQLYATINSLKSEVSVDEARFIYNHFFVKNAKKVSIDKDAVRALYSTLLGGRKNGPLESDILFGEVKDASLSILSGHWAQFKHTDSFQKYLEGPKIVISVESSDLVEVVDNDNHVKPTESDNPEAQINRDIPSTLPPTAAERQETSKSISAEISSLPSPPEKPARSSKLNGLPPPLPPRDNSLPPLPARESENEIEYARKKAEEEDLMFALALQEEENRSQSKESLSSSVSKRLTLEMTPNKSHSPSSSENPSPTLVSDNPLNQLKERVALIDAQLGESFDNSEVSQKLLTEKLSLQAQIEKLSEVDPEESTFRISENGSQVSRENLAPTLLGANISVFEVEDFSAVKGSRAIPQFSVLVEPQNGKAGWVLTRPLVDFYACYDTLAEQTAKVRGSVCPGLWIRTGAVTLPLQSVHRAALAREIEMWIHYVVSDESLCETMALQELLQPDHLQRKSVRGKKSTSVGQPNTVAFGQVLGALKSAGSVLKNVAVSTGTAIGNAAKEISAEARGGDRFDQKRMASLNGIPRSSSRNSSFVNSERPPTVKSIPRPDSATPRIEGVSDNQLPLIGSENPWLSESQILTESDPGSLNVAKAKSFVVAEALPPAPPTKQKRAQLLSSMELSVLLECAFGVIEEVFNLSDPTQWIRQRGLKVVKSVLRNSYGVTISEMIEAQAEEIRSAEAVSGYLDALSDSMWPNGVYVNSTPEYIAAKEQESLNPRTDEQRADTRIEAKNLLINNFGLLGLDGIQTVLGRQNTGAGISRLFNMLQHRDLNRGLICAVLEALVKSILADS
ncbi:sorting nexin 13 [Entophlyctis luteolus]|nr:sorting nexin 13 [Entophlyctis luteolus]KAJ3394460.1 sorting nexin 13 [Entophlyctis sp. JEL0112]